jgi:hypothetical protein
MQNVLAITIVLAAAMYLCWRAWSFIAARRASSCGGACHGCGAGSSSAPRQIVSLGDLQTNGTSEARLQKPRMHADGR